MEKKREFARESFGRLRTSNANERESSTIPPRAGYERREIPSAAEPQPNVK